jgi:hypothetical protein
MLNIPANDHPSETDFELSMFGNGFGECIVLHLGDKKWIVVDSMVTEPDGDSVAESYLRWIGVDIQTQLSYIVLTHSHTDHIAGSYKLAMRSHARVAISAAVMGSDLNKLFETVNLPSGVIASNAASELVSILREKRIRGTLIPDVDLLASDRKPLHNASLPCGSCVSVEALAPTREAVFAKTLDRHNDGVAAPLEKGLVPVLDHNNCSVVLLVKYGGTSALLGGDLEKKHPYISWDRIVEDSRGEVKATHFKVPHHGSRGSHVQDVWESLLVVNPLAYVSTYARLADPIPTMRDIDRMRSLAGSVYVTNHHRKSPPSTNAKRRALSSKGFVHIASQGKLGLIRLRQTISHPSAPQIELFGDAFRAYKNLGRVAQTRFLASGLRSNKRAGEGVTIGGRWGRCAADGRRLVADILLTHRQPDAESGVRGIPPGRDVKGLRRSRVMTCPTSGYSSAH